MPRFDSATAGSNLGELIANLKNYGTQKEIQRVGLAQKLAELAKTQQEANPLVEGLGVPRTNALIKLAETAPIPPQDLISGRLDSRQNDLDAIKQDVYSQQAKFGTMNPGAYKDYAAGEASFNKPNPDSKMDEFMKRQEVYEQNRIEAEKRAEERRLAAEGRRFGPDQARLAGDYRKEFIGRPEVKDYIEVNTNIKAMDALLKSALAGNTKNQLALDQGLITMFNKLTDPQSVVRESEYARTPQNLPIVNRIEGALKKIAEGGAGLTNEDREALVLAAKVIGNERGNQYMQTRQGYNKMAGIGNLNAELVTGVYPEFKPYQIGNPTSTPEQDSTGYIVGQQYKMKDGKMATYKGRGIFE